MLPSWIKKRFPPQEELETMQLLLRTLHLHTVCEEARCPNIGECFRRGTATFMILGEVCTRNCRFCAVKKGIPAPLDPEEPRRVAEAAQKLNLSHVVITSVTRDDLKDGGASVFAQTVREIRELLPKATVEILTPDFKGDERALHLLAKSPPDVFNHNLETVPRLYPQVRPQASYERSLRVLELAKQAMSGVFTKSGLMVGLGESREEVISVLKDLRSVNCDIITIGQYLRPTMQHLPVTRFVPPEEFEEYEKIAYSLGFHWVASGPFVRSSYLADAFFEALEKGTQK